MLLDLSVYTHISAFLVLNCNYLVHLSHKSVGSLRAKGFWPLEECLHLLRLSQCMSCNDGISHCFCSLRPWGCPFWTTTHVHRIIQNMSWPQCCVRAQHFFELYLQQPWLASLFQSLTLLPKYVGVVSVWFVLVLPVLVRHMWVSLGLCYLLNFLMTKYPTYFLHFAKTSPTDIPSLKAVSIWEESGSSNCLVDTSTFTFCQDLKRWNHHFFLHQPAHFSEFLAGVVLYMLFLLLFLFFCLFGGDMLFLMAARILPLLSLENLPWSLMWISSCLPHLAPTSCPIKNLGQCLTPIDYISHFLNNLSLLPPLSSPCSNWHPDQGLYSPVSFYWSSCLDSASFWKHFDVWNHQKRIFLTNWRCLSYV